MLEKLPCEILMLIADWLPPASLRALSRASSRVYSILIPQIYRTIAYRADSEWALNVLDVGSFFLHLGHSRAADYLQHARHLQIQAPFHLVRFNRCAYYNIFRTAGLPASPNTLGASDEVTAHARFLDDVQGQLQLIFTHLKPNSLSIFEWRLGTCVPMGVLDQGGYLSRYQRRLTRLSLVTDGTCPHEWHHLEGLSELSCLTAFEWEGIQHPTEADLLRQCIRHNWSHLDHLSIGFVPSAFAGALCWESLGLQQRELRVDDTVVEKPTAVPALSTLLLSKVTLPPDLSSEGISMFCALRALTLRDCPNQLLLLELLSQSRKPLQLEHFEISYDFLLHEPGEGRRYSAIARFLRSFRGLQHLHIRLSNFPASKSRIEDAIRHHRTTLKSLVYHERQLAPVDEDGLFEDDRDVSPVWIADLSTIVDLGRVTALALCASPSAASECSFSWTGPDPLSPDTCADDMFLYVSAFFILERVDWIELRLSKLSMATKEVVEEYPFFLPRVESILGNLPRARGQIYDIILQSNHAESVGETQFQLSMWPRTESSQSSAMQAFCAKYCRKLVLPLASR
ncbi:Cyclin-like F-box [Penicillium camemberti]|uniref:Cyclin-like F-box n=1 Tax=Penicillium camemberti (strain FM 013) TaxID=1429867 RepID=A0A0G4PXN4_PENC3|nr:Cyclin-like F-box [Penicillium camemberti]